jgi:outer membrane protein assembly factor BamB
VLSTVAVRGTTAFAQSHHSGMVAFEFGKGMKWRGYSFPETENFAASTPGIAGVALSSERCVFTTVRGELYVAAIESSGDLGRSFKPEPFKFQTPSGRLIASAPVIVNGCVYFGSDDGCLYGLSPDGGLKAAAAASPARPRGKLPSPTGRKYPCPGPYGAQGNTNYVDDAGLKAPFRLRWAVRLGAMSRSPLSASEDDVFGLALDGTLVAVEQETGRIRWRRRLEGPGWMQSPLCHEGRLYVPRPGALYCLDASDGSTKWSARIGKAVGPYPVLCDGVAAYANIPAGAKAPVLQAYDAGTGRELWQFKFAEYTDDVTVSGCILDGTFYFSCGAWKEPGLTVAMEPKSGKVLWENRENSCDNRTILAAADGRIFLPRFQRPLACLSAKDGSLLWTQKEWSSYRAPSVAPRLLSTRSYGGGDGVALNPETGEMLKRGQDVIRTGAPEHTCGPVFLTSSGLSLAVTVSGLHVRDLGPENKIVWSSLGFAPRACANAIAASGRVFCNPQNGMLYCFEPGGEKR